MQVAIGIRRKTPQIIERGQPLVASFTENLRPGRTYQVSTYPTPYKAYKWFPSKEDTYTMES